MLCSLQIKNIALIRELDLSLSPGLNILSGETGAGKSIIIDSLNFVLGDRADKSLIRHGENEARVTAVFEASEGSNARLVMQEAGIPEDGDTIIISRLMTTSGKSDCRVNGTICNIVTLKKIVISLVDIHSQHEHQALLNEANHIHILDSYAPETAKVKSELVTHLATYRSAEAELKTFPSEAERLRQEEMLAYEITEIEKVNVQEGEEEELINKRARLNNSQKIISSLSGALTVLNGEDGFGAATSVRTAIKELSSVSKYDTEIEKLIDRLESVKIEVEDMADGLESMISDSAFDPNELAAIESRLDDVRKIKKRYGATFEEIDDFINKAKEELDRLQNAEKRISDLERTIVNEGHFVAVQAQKLHDIRVKASEKLSKEIVKSLSELGMPHCTFGSDNEFPEGKEEILCKVTNNGADSLRFLISPNKGEPMKPLAKIASGGEMSRFMLGLKNITAELENIETLVFDEIDTGISGKIAKVVAEKLYDVSKSRQVIAITHLPQLASMSDNHYLISKGEVRESTLTSVVKLDEESLIKEIMRLSGSQENSESGYASAKELRASAIAYKQK